MPQGHKQYSMESTPMHELTYRVTNPTEAMRDELKKKLGCSVTWYDCNSFENEWEVTFEAEYEESFWDWTADYDLEFWLITSGLE